eukprot:366524-Chlamydomonas_euryale.AAC.12
MVGVSIRHTRSGGTSARCVCGCVFQYLQLSLRQSTGSKSDLSQNQISESKLQGVDPITQVWYACLKQCKQSKERARAALEIRGVGVGPQPARLHCTAASFHIWNFLRTAANKQKEMNRPGQPRAIVVVQDALQLRTLSQAAGADQTGAL